MAQDAQVPPGAPVGLTAAVHGTIRTAKPYFDDPYTTRFEATVASVREDGRGAWVALDRSYFYPGGGGQDCDLGALGSAAVVEVEEDEAGLVWHRVAGEASAPGTSVSGAIDPVRRLGNRQQHTGQHVLSQAFERVLGAITLSSRLGEVEGTVDLDVPGLTWEDAHRVEEAANAVVFEDRPVASLLVGPEDLDRFPLRKPPRVTGPVRLVVVENWDVSPCGGTHCTRTGEIGIIKVKRWEKFRGGTRVEFLCGIRALADYQHRMRVLVEAARRHNTSDHDVIESLERAAAERAGLAKTVKRLGESLAEAEAESWARNASPGTGAESRAAWSRRVEERDASGLRALASAALRRGAPAVVVAAERPEPTLLLTRPRGPGEDLRAHLPPLLEAAAGKGGGGPDLLIIVARDVAALEIAYGQAVERLGAISAGGLQS